MAPKVRLTAETDAERALERRYELLRKKKVEKAAKKTHSAGIRSTMKMRTSPEHSSHTRKPARLSRPGETTYSSPSNPHPSSPDLISAGAQLNVFAKDKSSCKTATHFAVERDPEIVRTAVQLQELLTITVVSRRVPRCKARHLQVRSREMHVGHRAHENDSRERS